MKRFLKHFSIGGVREFSMQNAINPNTQKSLKIEGIKDIIAVASGKGGVGKSTTSVNLAVSLAKRFQLKVGLLDADIYGPSIPLMMRLQGKPELSNDRKMIPIESYGVKCISIGSLVDEREAIVWRGPMVMKSLEQLTRGVDWGILDVLVIDMPPGTGDAQISISQRLQLSGGLIVSTPQDVALLDARRGVKMFSKVNVPILGILENMSYFKCPKCSEASYIFGQGGARKTAEEMGLKFLGEIPLEVEIRSGSDEGVPIVMSKPDSVISQVYGEVAEKVVIRLEEVDSSKIITFEQNFKFHQLAKVTFSGGKLPDMRAIFCGNLEFEARQSDVERLFRRYGKVDRVDMKSGFAFIYMEDERDADDAIRRLDRIEFGKKGRRLRVEWTKEDRGGSRRPESSRKPTANTKPSKTLFVINFDPVRTRTRDIERYFEPYGRISNVRIRRNFAFVQYESEDDASRALEATNMSKFMDRVISVEFAIRDDDDRRNGRSPDRRARDMSPGRRFYDHRRSPSPYRMDRGSPDYGHGAPVNSRPRTRGSPEYGRAESPVNERYHSRSPPPRERSRS